MRDKNFCLRALNSIYSLATKIPKNIAVVDCDGKRKTSYYDYVKIINSYAYYLNKKNLKVGDVVVIEIGRCMEHFALRYACAFLGLVFLSMDPLIPEARRKAIYSDCNADLIITKDTLEAITIDNFPCQINKNLDDDSLFCIVYTSGTTGVPKGILHDRSILEICTNVDCSVIKDLNLDANEERPSSINSTALSDVTFILSIADTFFPHSHNGLGGCVHIISPKIILNPNSLKQYFIDMNIQITFILPGLLRAIMPLESLKLAFVSGEPCNYSFADCQNTLIYNLYGSSEATAVAFEDVRYNNAISRTCSPDANLFIDGNKVGELCYTGPSVLVRYINNKKLSDETISIDNKTGYRTLRTRDKAMYRDDGKIQIIGRLDSTVKIRGKRVDIAEVEYTLSSIEGIVQSVVKDFGDDKNKYLCAYYTTINKKPLEKQYIADELSKIIPSYMIPKFFVHKLDFERNPRGKIQKKSLAEPEPNTIKNKYHIPTNDIETKICKAYEKVFRIDNIGIDDDFVALGGDSLSAIEVIANCKLDELTINDLYVYRTPKEIASRYKNNNINLKKQNLKLSKKTFKLSLEQIYILDHQFKEPFKIIWNIPVLIKMKKDVNPKRLAAAVDRAILHHFAFQLKIVVNDEGEFVFKYDENLFTNTKIVATTEKEFKEMELVRRFKLVDTCLTRHTVYTTEKSVYLFLDNYHLIIDGVSYKVLFNDIYKCYIEQNAILNNDYLFVALTRDNQLPNTKQYESAKKHYNKFDISNMDIALKYDFDSQRNRVGVYKKDISRLGCDVVNSKLAKKIGNNALFLLAFNLATAKYNQSTNAVTEWVTNGRDSSIKQNVCYLLYKSCPLIIDYLKYDTLSKLVNEVKHQIQFSTAHSYYPYIYLNSDFDKEGNAPCFIYQDNIYDLGALDRFVDDCKYDFDELDGCNCDLECSLIANNSLFHLNIAYAKDKYQYDSIKKFIDIFCDLLSFIINNEENDNCRLI